MTINTLASAQFPGAYLRMDGQEVNKSLDNGSGKVNCQFGVGRWERFRLEKQADGSFAVASVQFPAVYLRLDGSNLTKPMPSGGGVVNCQYGAGPWEKFRLHPQEDGTSTLESVSFPGIYLRMDASGVSHKTDSGGGRVNAQVGAGTHEKFYVSY